MSASIIGGAQLGLLDSTLATLGRNDQTAAAGQQEGGVFVNAAKGNLVYSTRDAFLASSGEDFLLNRTYNSQSEDWRLSASVNVEVDENDSSLIRVVYGDGTKKEFKHNGDESPRTYASTDGAGAYEILTQLNEGGWSLLTSDQSVWQFDSSNNITSKTDTNGYQISYEYDGDNLKLINDSNDHNITFNYTAGKLTSITTDKNEAALKGELAEGESAAGESILVSYTYYDSGTNIGKLKTSTDFNDDVTTYSYNNDGLLSKIDYPQTKSDGSNDIARSIEFSYVVKTIDNEEVILVSSYKDADGNETTFLYDDINQIELKKDETFVEVLGTELDYTGHEAAEFAMQWESKVYNSGGQYVIYEDNLYRSKWYAQASDIPGIANVWEKVVIPEKEVTVTHTFEGFSSLDWVTGTEYARTQVVDALGNNRATSNEQEYRDWRNANGYYEWHSEGLSGNDLLTKQRILAQHSMIYATDDNGNIVEVVDQNGYHTVYEYDDEDDNLRFKLDAQGWAITRSDSSEMRALRVELGFAESIAELNQNPDAKAALEELFRSEYRYDDNGNLQFFIDNDGSVIEYSYNESNRLETVISAVGHALVTSNEEHYQDLRVELGYQAIIDEENPISDTHRQELLDLYTSRNVYDVDDPQLIEYSLSAGGDRIDYVYYKNETGGDYGQLKQEIKTVTNQDGETVQQITQYTYDDLGQVTSITQALDAAEESTTHFVYDAFGNLRTTQDANEGVTTMVYDNDHRMASMQDAKGNITTYAYDAVGNILTTTNADNNVISRLYDANNRLMSETLVSKENTSKDRVTSYTYDVYGNVKSMTNAGGHTTNYEYDAANQLVKVISTQVNDVNDQLIRYETTYGYDGEGRQIWVNDNNGHTTRFIYDQDGLLIKTISADGHETKVSFDDNGNRVKIISGVQLAGTAFDHKQQITEFVYDEENQLIRQTNPDNTSTEYTYDEVGNMNSQILVGNQGGEIKSEFIYDLKNRLVTEILPEAEVLEFDEDTQEYVSTLTTSTRQYAYDANNNQIAVTDENGVTSSYWYDASNNKILMRHKHETDSADGSENWVYTSYSYDQLNRQTSVRINITIDEEIDEHGNVQPIIDRVNTIQNPNQAPQWEEGKTYLRGDQITYNGSIWEARHSTTSVPTSPTDEYNIYVNWVRLFDANELHVSVDDTHAQITRYRYNEFNELVETVSALGHKLLFSNEEKYALIRSQILPNEISADDQVSDISPEEKVKLIQKNSQQFIYNKLGLMIKEINNETEVSSYNYDGLNRLVSGSDRSWSNLEKWYDGNGNVVKEEYNNNKISTSTYDAMNRNLTITREITVLEDEDGAPIYPLITTNVYDTFGNLLEEIKNKDVQQFNANGYLHNMEVSTSYLYDNMNRMTSMFDQEQKEVSYQYDEFGRRWKVTDANGNTTETLYNSRNQIIKAVDALTNETKFEYDAVGNQLRIQDPRDNYTSFVYDFQNKVTETHQLVDGETRITKVIYDDFGRQSTVVTGFGSNDEVKTHFEYRADNLVDKVTDAQGNEITHTYDQLSRKISTEDQNGNVTQWEYDQLNRLEKTTDALGNETRISSYDANNNVTGTYDAKNQYTKFYYDASSNLLETTDAGNNLVKIAYDKLERQSKIFNPDGSVAQSFTYYDDGQLRTQSDALGNTTTYYYDDNNNMIREVNALDHETRYVYDALNRVSIIVDAQGHPTQYRYDESGNRVQVISGGTFVEAAIVNGEEVAAHVVGGIVQQTSIYNEANEIQYQIDGEGYVTQFIYTAAGKIESQITYNANVTSPTKIDDTLEDSISDQLDSFIENLNETNIKSENSFIYDELGRLAYQIDGELGLKKVEYDLVGNVIASSQFEQPLTTRTLIESEISNQIDGNSDQVEQRSQTIYDALNRPVYQISAEGYVTEIKYDALGNVTDTYSYGAKAELDSELNVILEDDILVFAGANDEGFINETRHTHFEYNFRNQVILETSPGGIVTEYKYDNIGNRTDIIEALGLPEERTTHFVYDAANRLTDQFQAFETEDQVQTHFELNELGQIRQKIEAYETENARTTDFVYYDNNRLRMTTVTLNDTEEFDTYQQYDAVGNVVLSVSGDITIDGDNFTADQNARTSTYDYDANNRLTDQFTTLENAYTNDEGQLIEAVIRHDKHVYGALGNKTSSTNAYGTEEARITSYVYDADSRLAFMTDGENNVTQYIYDGADNLVTQTSGYDTDDAKTVEYKYDLDNRRTDMIAAQKLVDAEGNYTIDNVTHYEYDAVGNLTDQFTGYGLSGNNLLGEDTQKHTQFEYDLLNRQTAIVTGEGNRTEFVFDDLNRQTEIHTWVQTAPGVEEEAIQRFWYNNLDQNTHTLSAFGYLTVQEFNEFGQVTDSFLFKDTITLTDVTVAPVKPATTQIVDGVEVTTAIINHYEYDAAGRLTSMTDPIKTTAYEYNLLSDMVVQRDAAGTILERISTFKFDDAGRLTDQTIAIGVETQEVNGEYEVVLDNQTNQPVLNYDEAVSTHYELNVHGQTQHRFDNYSVAIDAQSGEEVVSYGAKTTYFYDGNGRVEDEISRDVKTYIDGNTDDFELVNIGTRKYYDAHGNVSSTVTFQYEFFDDGRIQSAGGRSGQEITNFIYNDDNKLLTETKHGNPSLYNITTSYGYDSAGNMTSTIKGMGENSVVSSYIYDLDNRQKMILEGGLDTTDYKVATEFEFDSSGNVVTKKSGNLPVQDELDTRLVESFEYDLAGRLTKKTNASEGALQNVTHYEYDIFNNVITETNGLNSANEQITTRRFDDGSRLEFEIISGEFKTTHVYDALGRLTDIKTENTELADGIQTQAFEYDIKGNQTKAVDSLGFGTVMTYNWQNQIETQRSGEFLLTVTDDNSDLKAKEHISQMEYEYDSRGRKIKETQVHFDANNNESNIENVFNYNSFDKLVTAVYGLMPNNNAISRMEYLYLSDGQLFKETNNGIETFYRYHNSGLLEFKSSSDYSVSPENYPRTDYIYDSAGRVSEETLQLSANEFTTTKYEYDEFGNLEFKIEGFGQVDDQGRDISRQMQYIYDNENRVILEKIRLFNTDSSSSDEYMWIDQAGYSYDNLGNLTSQSTWVMTQDAEGVDQLEQARALMFYNNLNQQTLSVSPEGYVTQTHYDGHGNVKDVYSAQLPLTTKLDDDTTYSASEIEAFLPENNTFIHQEFEYDDLNRQTASISHYGDGAFMRYESEYDGAGNVINQHQIGKESATSDEVSVTTHFEFDDLNRQTDVYVAYGTIDQVRTYFEYNSLNQISAQFENYQVIDGVESWGRKTESTYNGRGQLLTQKVGVTDEQGEYSENYFVNKYDEFGQLAYSATGKYIPSTVVEDEVTDIPNQEFNILNGENIVVDNMVDGFITVNTYDLAGRMLTQTQGEGDEQTVTTYEYDFAGNKTRDILGYETGKEIIVDYRYDLQNRLSAQIKNDVNENGEPVTFTTAYNYDNSGNLLTQIVGVELEPEDKHQVTQYRYDEQNRVVFMQDAEGYITTYQYDSLGNVIAESKEGQVQQNYYNEIGQLEIKISSGGTKQVNTYDELGRLESTTTGWAEDTDVLNDDFAVDNVDTEIDESDVRTTTYGYDLRGNQTKITDAEGYTANIHYDWMNNQTYVKSGSYELVAGDEGFNQDKLDRVLEVEMSFAYNELGQMTSSTDALETITEFYYDALGNRTETIEGVLIIDGIKDRDADRVHHKVTTFDSVGRESEVRNAAGGYVLNAYNSLGQLETVTVLREGVAPTIGSELTEDAVVNLTSYTYNGRGMQTSSIIDMGNGFKNFEMHTVYDAFGNVAASIKGKLSQDDGQSQAMSYEYDKLNRKTKETDGEQVVTNFEYDAYGNNIRLEKAGAITYLIYNNANQLSATLDPVENLSIYNYDSVGNVINSVQFKNMLTYGYNEGSIFASDETKNDILQAAQDGKLVWNDEDQTLASDIQVFDLSTAFDRQSTSSEYDGNNNVKTTESSLGYRVGASSNTQNVYDSQGNLITETQIPTYGTDTRTTTFVYDNASRLIETYDSVANATAVVVNAQTGEKSYSEGVKTSYTYDEFNNKTSETLQAFDAPNINNTFRTTEYVYDKANRELISVSDRKNIEQDFEGWTEQELAEYRAVPGLEIVQAYSYDLAGNKVEFIEAAQINYDQDNGISLVEGSGIVTSYTHFANGLVKTESQIIKVFTDEEGNKSEVAREQVSTTTYKYDAAANMVSKVDPRDVEYTFEYDNKGQLLVEVMPYVDITRAVYNSVTENYEWETITAETLEENEERITREHTYDAFGNEIQVTDASGYSVTQWFDANNRLIAFADATNVLTTYEYDGYNNKTKEHFYNEFQTSEIHEILANQVNEAPVGVENNKVTTTYNYDILGQLKDVFYAETEVSELVYDVNDVATGVTSNSESLRESFGYDQWGNQTTLVDKNGATTYKFYDANNRVSAEVDSEGFMTFFEYDRQDNIVKQVSYIEEKYDASKHDLTLGEPVLTSKSLATYREFDTANRLITETTGQETFWEVKDVNGTISLVESDTQAYVTAYTYDDRGNQLSRTRAAGSNQELTEYYFYDDAGRVELFIDPAGVVTHSGFDKNGNITSDKVYFDKITATTQSFFDAFENQNISVIVEFLKENTTNDKETSYIYNAHNRAESKTLALTEEDILTNYRYDAVGNKTQEEVLEFDSIKTKYTNLSTYDVDLDNLNSTSYWSHNGNGEINIAKEPSGSATFKTFDARGNVESAYTGQADTKLVNEININQPASLISGLQFTWPEMEEVSSWKLYISTNELPRDLNDVDGLAVINLSAATTSYVYESATPGETYFVRLVAVDDAQNKRSTGQIETKHAPLPINQSWSAANSDDANLSFEFNHIVSNVSLDIGNDTYTFSANGLTYTSEVIANIAQLSGEYTLNWEFEGATFSSQVQLGSQSPFTYVEANINFERDYNNVFDYETNQFIQIDSGTGDFTFTIDANSLPSDATEVKVYLYNSQIEDRFNPGSIIFDEEHIRSVEATTELYQFALSNVSTGKLEDYPISEVRFAVKQQGEWNDIVAHDFNFTENTVDIKNAITLASESTNDIWLNVNRSNSEIFNKNTSLTGKYAIIETQFDETYDVYMGEQLLDHHVVTVSDAPFMVHVLDFFGNPKLDDNGDEILVESSSQKNIIFNIELTPEQKALVANNEIFVSSRIVGASSWEDESSHNLTGSNSQVTLLEDDETNKQYKLSYKTVDGDEIDFEIIEIEIDLATTINKLVTGAHVISVTNSPVMIDGPEIDEETDLPIQIASTIEEYLNFNIKLNVEELNLLGAGDIQIASRINNESSWDDISSNNVINGETSFNIIENIGSQKQYKLYFTATDGKEVLLDIILLDGNNTDLNITRTQASFDVDTIILNSSLSSNNDSISVEPGYRSDESISLTNLSVTPNWTVIDSEITQKVQGNETGYYTTYQYDNSGNLTGTNENDGVWRTFKNDAYGNAIQTVKVGVEGNTSDTITEYSQFDSKGNKTAQYDMAVTYASTGSTVQSITTMQYDGANNVVKENYSNGSYREFEYNIFNVETKNTLQYDVGSAKISIETLLDIHSREIIKKDGAGVGLGETSESPNQQETGVGTAKVYNTLGKVTKEYLVNADGSLSQDIFKEYEVDNFGRVTKQIEMANVSQAINYQYNQADQVTHISKGDNELRTSFELDSQGNQVGITYENGVVRTQVFNRSGQVVHTKIQRNETTSGNNATKQITTTTHYDVLGNELSTIDEMGYITSKTYGAFGRVLTQTNANGHVKTFEYDDFGRVTREYTVVASVITTDIAKDYDVLGRLILVNDIKESTSTRYTYDVDGNRATERLSAKDGFTQSMSYKFDARGNMTDVTIVDSEDTTKTVNWQYDDGNKLLEVTSTYGTTTDKETYRYNDKGQLQSILENGSEIINYTYYANGQIKTATNKSADSDNTATKTYFYNANGLILKATWSGWISTWSYDSRGNLTKYVEITKSNYDAALSEESVSDQNKAITNNAAFYQESKFTTDNQKWKTTSYDVRGLTGDEKKETKVQTTTMTLDNKGRSTKNHISDGGDLDYYTNIGYNRLGNKTSEITNSSNMEHVKATNSRFTYNANGNLTQVKIDKSGDTTASTKTFVLNNDGQIIKKNVVGGNINAEDDDNDAVRSNGVVGEYYYANGNQIGRSEHLLNDDGNREGSRTTELATGAFRLVQVPGDDNPTAGISSYTAQGGETLQQVAANMLGNANLWFVIAQANGLDANSTLVAGQTIEIPQSVESVKIDSSTHKQYSESEIVGSTTPGLDQVPPKPSKCQQVMAVVAVIAIVVVAGILTAGVGAVFAAGLGGGVIATVVGFAVAGAIIAAGASIVKQVATSVILTGKLPEEIDWDAVKEEAIAGAIAGAASGFGAAAKLADVTAGWAKVLKLTQLAINTGTQIHQNTDPETGDVDNQIGIVAKALIGAYGIAGPVSDGTSFVSKASKIYNEYEGYVTPWKDIAVKAIDGEELESADWIDAIGGTITNFLDRNIIRDDENTFAGSLKGAALRTGIAAGFALAASNEDEEAGFDFFKNYAGQQFGTAIGNGIANIDFGAGSLTSFRDNSTAKYYERGEIRNSANQYSEKNNLDKHQQTSLTRRIKDGQYDGKSGSSLEFALNKDFNAQYLADQQANAESRGQGMQAYRKNEALLNTKIIADIDAKDAKKLESMKNSAISRGQGMQAVQEEQAQRLAELNKIDNMQQSMLERAAGVQAYRDKMENDNRVFYDNVLYDEEQANLAQMQLEKKLQAELEYKKANQLKTTTSNYWSEQSDSVELDGSLANFGKIMFFDTMGALGNVGTSLIGGGGDLIDDPKKFVTGNAKAVANFGPDMFNGAVGLVKLTADGYVEIAQIVTGDEEFGQFFLDSEAYQIEPLFKLDEGETVGSLIGSLATGKIITDAPKLASKFSKVDDLADAGTVAKTAKIDDLVDAGTAVKTAKADQKLLRTEANAKTVEEASLITQGKACFTAGTTVQTNNGLKAIEDFAIGDQVLARDEQTGEITYKRVINTKQTKQQQIYKVEIQNHAGKVETYATTEEHPFWIKDHGWVRAADLTEGNVLVDSENRDAIVLSMIKTDEIETVYNIEVLGFHTYFVGELNIWVHNANCWAVDLKDKLDKGEISKSEYVDKVNTYKKLENKLGEDNVQNYTVSSTKGGIVISRKDKTVGEKLRLDRDGNVTVAGKDDLEFSTTTQKMRNESNAVGSEYVNPYTNKVETVTQKMVDDGIKFSPDHVVPVKDIKQMKGFDKLSKEDQMKVIYHDSNIQNMPSMYNQSKGGKNLNSGDKWNSYDGTNTKVDNQFNHGKTEFDKGYLKDLKQAQFDQQKILQSLIKQLNKSNK
ncbi:polymorphic toxin-type HINT domain-containing protein [Marinicellulosiphila megalodicopiae]|uniref:polymorphic toxin-type HINT domain-containing protein n=1 Tax=Marinicellulosiphila megalodicopiae TaxID=2724896 RepID=UPI003BAF9B2E